MLIRTQAGVRCKCGISSSPKSGPAGWDAPLTTLLHPAFVSLYVGGVWSRSGSHCMPQYSVIPALWLIGLCGSVCCSCGAVTQGDSCSVRWKSHRSSSLLEDRRTTQFAWMLRILYVFFEGGAKRLNSMNTSSGRAGGLSRHPYHSIFFQMQLNGLAFVRIGN